MKFQEKKKTLEVLCLCHIFNLYSDFMEHIIGKAIFLKKLNYLGCYRKMTSLNIKNEILFP